MQIQKTIGYSFMPSFLWAVFLMFSLTTNFANAAPKTELIPFWQPSDEANMASINHEDWQFIIDEYLIDDHASGVNRFEYSRVSTVDKTRLDHYLETLQNLDPREYKRSTQKAYWINLYNALTIKLILDNYPVETITSLGEGFFSFGPWDDKVALIEGQELTLNDIEHGILRPIWQDNRIHYAVNCASISCPNLSAEAFTSKNTDRLLKHSARTYVNHTRGVKFEADSLVLSSIYDWYLVDFGGQEKTLLIHLQKYADQTLMEKLKNHSGEINYSYDWQLNEPQDTEN